MEKFVVLVDNNSVAGQIATLLNKYNRLQTIHTEATVLSSKINYLVEYSSTNNGLVVGCVGISKEDQLTTLFQHLCVDELSRRKGIGSKLLTEALKKVNTRFVEMRIRHTNMPSLCLARSLGFFVVDCNARNDYYILTVRKEIYATKN